MLMEYIQEKAKEGDHVLAVDKEVTEKDRFAQGKFSSLLCFRLYNTIGLAFTHVSNNHVLTMGLTLGLGSMGNSLHFICFKRDRLGY